LSGAFFAQTAEFIAFMTETVVAYPFAAFWAAGKMKMRGKVCLVKNSVMLGSPEHFTGFVIYHYGTAAFGKRFNRTYPFLAADFAKKTERKTARIRMVNNFCSKRFTKHDLIFY
jgi:hypothetical protein